MRRWQNLAAPDDPGSWYDVDGVYPTNRGTYERVYFGEASNLAATGAGDVRYCFAEKTVAGTVSWIVDGAKIWLGPTSLADRTNGVTIGTYPYMCQFGNVTICAMGTATATVGSTSGGNFAAIAGVPNCEIVAVCSNAVGYFNTSTSADGYTISDVGDHTNVTTGEAVTGRLLQTPGAINAVVVYQDAFYVFKGSAVYRMRYVGGLVKWIVELLHGDIGCTIDGGAFSAFPELKYAAAASHDGIFFMSGFRLDSSIYGNNFYWMNGSGQFTCVTPLTFIGTTAAITTTVFIRHNADQDIFSVYCYNENTVWFFNPANGSWGRSTSPNGAAGVARPVMGGPTGLSGHRVHMPVAYYKSAADVITKYTPNRALAGKSCYLETSMVGKPNRKTKFLRCIPLLRRRTDRGTDSAALSVTRFRELHDTTAANTDAVTESTQRKRFDMALTDNFARFKVTFTDLDVEVDDFLIDAADAGRD